MYLHVVINVIDIKKVCISGLKKNITWNRQNRRKRPFEKIYYKKLVFKGLNDIYLWLSISINLFLLLTVNENEYSYLPIEISPIGLKPDKNSIGYSFSSKDSG